MNGTSKRNLHIGIVYACLLLATAVVSHLNAPGLPAPLFVGLGMSCSCLHAAMLAFWLYSVRRRVPDALPRRLLSASAGLLILWIALKATKYYLCDSIAIDRYLWYLYYLPILFVPLLFLLIAMSLNKPEDFRLPRWTLLPSAAAAALFLLVLTNDLHQLVFVFPSDAAVFSDENYAYGPGYFLAAGWAVLCAAAAFALMIRKCRLSARRVLWVPLIPLGTAILYSVLYGAGSPIVWRTVPDLSVFLGFCLAAVLECCIGCGLIRSNTHYRELFEQSALPVTLTDPQGRTFLRSASARDIAPEEAAAAREEPIVNGEQKRLSSLPIRGGYVLWEDDVSEIVRTIEELQEASESLEEKHELAREEARTRERSARLQEANRLYAQMQQETAPQLSEMEALLDRLEKTEDPKAQKALLVRLAVLGAYFKRRGNLMFLAESGEEAASAELQRCLQESLYALQLQGARGECAVEAADLSLPEATALYDAFEEVLQTALADLKAVAVFVRRQGREAELLMQLSLSESTRPDFGEALEAEEEGDGEWSVRFALREGGRP